MRISTNPDERGYRTYQLLRKRGIAVRVTVDGVEMRRVVLADTRRGVVVTHAADADGRIQSAVARATIKRVRHFGKVQVQLVRE